MKRIVLTISIFCLIAMPVFAQQRGRIIPNSQSAVQQPYTQNAPQIMSAGNSLNQPIVMPQSGQQQGNSFSSNGVKVQNLRPKKGSNQQFINQSLGRDPQLENRSR